VVWEGAGEGGLLQFPEERHGDGEGEQGEEQEQKRAERLEVLEQDADLQRGMRPAPGGDPGDDEQRQQDEAEGVQAGKRSGFQLENRIRQGDGETPEQVVQTEQESQTEQREQGNGGGEERRFGEALIPVKERG
jgi:hypothetical protein